jgi:6-phosphogluconolactonase
MKKASFLLFVIFLTIQANAQNYNLLIGTYTNKGTSEGIYVYNFNAKTGVIKLKSTTKTINPSYLTVSKDKKFVYSVNQDGKNSTVSSFGFNGESGELSFVNKRSAAGEDPCFIIADEKNVIIANYSSGNISVLGRNADGSLTDVKQTIQHTGKSIEPKRQMSAHVHQVLFTSDKRYLISNDLGEDVTYSYKYDAESAIPLTSPKAFKTNPGSGPRHLAFTPNGKFAYLAHEFTGTITAFSFAKGDFINLQEIGTIAKDYKGRIDGADIHVSPDGKFLYETNRGDANTINLFAIAANGTLTFIEAVSTLGNGPRNFTIDPSGNFLLVAHQYTNDVVIFNRDKKTGKLKDTGKRINVGVPVCLVFSK